MRLTTARYFTPSGISIQARGIVPDIVVSQRDISEQEAGPQMREKDLTRHFQPLQKKPPVEGGPEQKSRLSEEDKADYQLIRALDLLKGFEIINRRQSPAA